MAQCYKFVQPPRLGGHFWPRFDKPVVFIGSMIPLLMPQRRCIEHHPMLTPRGQVLIQQRDEPVVVTRLDEFPSL